MLLELEHKRLDFLVHDVNEGNNTRVKKKATTQEQSKEQSEEEGVKKRDLTDVLEQS